MKAPTFPLIAVNTLDLIWHGGEDEPVFSAEMAELKGKYGNQLFRRVYDDAADMGFYVVSNRTGRKVLFTISNVQYSTEGDLQWVELKPAEDVGVDKLMVFND